MAEVIDWIGPPADVRVVVGPDMPTFNLDRLRFAQVVANLIGNAVKYGRAGGSVRVRREAAPAGYDGFQFVVADDGPGIDPKYHERIFGVFQTLQPRDKGGRDRYRSRVGAQGRPRQGRHRRRRLGRSATVPHSGSPGRESTRPPRRRRWHTGRLGHSHPAVNHTRCRRE